jgi:hypothetical protein
MDRGYTPKQFEGLFAAAASDADQRIHQLFCSEFGPTLCKQRSGGQCCTSLYEVSHNLTCFILYDSPKMDIMCVCVIDYEVPRGRQNEVVIKEVSVAAENVIDISFEITIHHDRSRLRQERPFLGRWPARLRKASQNYKRGRLCIRASVRLWHSKDQISHRIAGAACTKSGGFQVPRAPRPQVTIQLQNALPQNLSKLQLRYTKCSNSIQMGQASPLLPLLYQLSTRIYMPYRLI